MLPTLLARAKKNDPNIERGGNNFKQALN